MRLRLGKREKILIFTGSTLIILALVVPLLVYGIIKFNYNKLYSNTICYYDGYNITNQTCDGQTYTGILRYYLYYNNNTINDSFDIICSDDIHDIKIFFNNYSKEWDCWYSSTTNNVSFKLITDATGMIIGGTVVLTGYICLISIYLVIKERKNHHDIYQSLYYYDDY